jgi:hypothetical protein
LLYLDTRLSYSCWAWKTNINVWGTIYLIEVSPNRNAFFPTHLHVLAPNISYCFDMIVDKDLVNELAYTLYSRFILSYIEAPKAWVQIARQSDSLNLVPGRLRLDLSNHLGSYVNTEERTNSNPVRTALILISPNSSSSRTVQAWRDCLFRSHQVKSRHLSLVKRLLGGFSLDAARFVQDQPCTLWSPMFKGTFSINSSHSSSALDVLQRYSIFLPSTNRTYSTWTLHAVK